MIKLITFVSLACLSLTPPKVHIPVKVVSGNADYIELQYKIDSAIACNGKIFLKRNYTIDKPIIAASWNSITGQYDQVFFTMEGTGKMWDKGAGTTITATFNDAPIFSIQKGKGCVVSGVTFQGPGIGRDSRYSPQAAICIDPFSGLIPGDGGYPTLTSWYRGPQSRSGSTGCRFEDITTGGTTVGIIISPNGYTQNAELLTFQNIRFGVHKYGFAGCQSQEKLNRLINVAAWSSMEYLFVFNTYGAQQPGNYIIDGVNIAGSVKHIIYRASTGWGPMFMKNVFAESIIDIGYWQTLTGDALSDFLINFDFSKLPAGTLPVSHIQGGGVTLSHGELRYYGQTYPVVLFAGQKPHGETYALENVKTTAYIINNGSFYIMGYQYGLPDGVTDAECTRPYVNNGKVPNAQGKLYAFFLDDANTYIGYAFMQGDSMVRRSSTVLDGHYYKTFFR